MMLHAKKLITTILKRSTYDDEDHVCLNATTYFLLFVILAHCFLHFLIPFCFGDTLLCFTYVLGMRSDLSLFSKHLTTFPAGAYLLYQLYSYRTQT